MGLLDSAPVVGPVLLASNAQLSGVEVDVGPSEATGFGWAEAVAAAEVDEDEAGVLRCVEEGLELIRIEGSTF